MKSVALICVMLVPLVVTMAVDSNQSQLVQTNVNVQNNVDSSVGGSSDKTMPVESELQAKTSIQQEVLSASQQDDNQPPSLPPSGPMQQQVPVQSPQQQSPSIQLALDPQTVQLLREANAQYQYQINSRFEEKTRPVYANVYPTGSQYSNQAYPYFVVASRYPHYKENSQYQELGNGQKRTETNLLVGDNMNTQVENQDQSAYSQRRSQSYLEYGKGEMSPDYNTYAYKRTYY